MAPKQKRELQLLLPGVLVLEAGGKKIEMGSRRIPHSRILKALLAGSDAGRSIVEIYRIEVLPVKTRTIHLLGRKCPATIIHTLLGFEVQACYKRIHCPDLVTARYLRLFTELGCRRIRLPYDPTITGRLIPELEATQERLSEGVRQLFPRNHALQAYVLRRIYTLIRPQLRSE
jgi:hypothetical protein